MEKIERNCNTCRVGYITGCDALENSKEYQAIIGTEMNVFKQGAKAHEFRENFVCDEYKCRYIEYPLEISEIKQPEYAEYTKRCAYQDKVGKYVKVRPADGDKTYLGIFLGSLPINLLIAYKEEKQVLDISYHNNPAMFVFELNKIVFGCESWWSTIESPEDLEDITDETLNDQWYVKIMKSFGKEEK